MPSPILYGLQFEYTPEWNSPRLQCLQLELDDYRDVVLDTPTLSGTLVATVLEGQDAGSIRLTGLTVSGYKSRFVVFAKQNGTPDTTDFGEDYLGEFDGDLTLDVKLTHFADGTKFSNSSPVYFIVRGKSVNGNLSSVSNEVQATPMAGGGMMPIIDRLMAKKIRPYG